MYADQLVKLSESKLWENIVI